MLSTLATQTARNVSFIGISQIIALIMTFLTVAVLARILTADDFGIASIGLIFVALLIVFQDFGVLSAVVQRDTRVEESISVGLTLRWMIAAACMVLVVLLSPFLADFYDNPDLTAVLVVISFTLFIQPLAFSSLATLTRTLSFSRLAVAAIVQSLATAIASIALAFAGFSYWSIVFGSLVGNSANVIVLLYYEPTFVRPKIDKGLMKELLGFGLHLLVTGLMAFLIFNIDQLVVGKVLGITILGFFFVAVRFGRTLGEQISGTVNRVLFPTMARIKDSAQKLKTGYVQSLRMISIIVFPLSLGLSALSSPFIEVVLGEGWTLAAVPLAILSLQGLMNALIAPSANVLVSIGKPKYMSAQATVQAAIIVVGVYPAAAYYGVNGVCVLTTVVSLGVLVYFLKVFSSVFKVRFFEIARPMFPPMLSGLLTYVFLLVMTSLLPIGPLSLIALVFVGGGLYVALLHLVSKGRDVRDFTNLTRRSLLNRQEV